MLKTRFVMMNFGADPSRFWQAYWSLLSVMVHAPNPYEILVFTDHPEFFGWFEDTILVYPVSREELADWVGPHDYFFRALIKVIETGLIVDPKPDVVFYLDSDTAVNVDLQPVIDGVRAGHIYMDRREYNCYRAYRDYQWFLNRNKGAHRLWQATSGREWAGVSVNSSTEMWNTGITVLSQADEGLLRKALQVNDAMLDGGCSHRLTEQIAMSVVLDIPGRTHELNGAGHPPIITHYWGNKRGWHESITASLATIQHQNMTVGEAVVWARNHPVNRPAFTQKPKKWHRLLGLQPIN